MGTSINIEFKGIRTSFSEEYVKTAGLAPDKMADEWLKNNKRMLNGNSESDVKKAIITALKPHIQTSKLIPPQPVETV